MRADAKIGIAETQKRILRDAAEAIRIAKEGLGRASDAALGYDREMVEQIRDESTSLDAFLARLTEAQSITDEALLGKAARDLRLQATPLRASSDRIKEMASGTKPTPGVVGYMDEAVTLIAQALAFIAELP